MRLAALPHLVAPLVRALVLVVLFTLADRVTDLVSARIRERIV